MNEWIKKHNIPKEAVDDLRHLLSAPSACETLLIDDSETAAQSAVRLAASKAGWRLFRNNVGAGHLQNGRFIRWGLANDSHAVNVSLKSGDLIGIKPIVITNEHVGTTIGQFVSREMKKPSWVYSGSDREIAQLKWIELITALGGDAKFSTGGL